MAEVKAEIVLDVPRWTMYRFLNVVFSESRLAKEGSDASLLIDRPKPPVTNPSELEAVIARIRRIVGPNPWLSREVTEIVTTLENLKPKTTVPRSTIDAVPASPAPKMKVVDDVPPSRLELETDIGQRIIRVVIDLSDQGESTRLLISAKEPTQTEKSYMQSVLSAVIQVVVAFETGYKAGRKAEEKEEKKESSSVQ